MGLFHAQFGFELGPMGMDQKRPFIRNIFRVAPDFKKYWQECYIPKFALQQNEPKPSFDWIAINYPF